jgi:hypothetical protein
VWLLAVKRASSTSIFYQLAPTYSANTIVF